jgi:transcriptional regulator with XRE-family HTH domain
MDKKVTGFIIRRERMRRDWSQDGLCRGICAASYLSKIEQGRVEASEEVLRLLYQRLGLPWYGGDAALPGLSERIDELYELAYSGEFEKLDDRLSAMEPEREALLLSPAAPDIAVLEAAAAWRGGSVKADDAMAQYLAPRGLALHAASTPNRRCRPRPRSCSPRCSSSCR